MKDLSELDSVSAANEGVEVELVNPKTGAGTGIFVRILGSDSDVFRKKTQEQQQRRMSRLFKGGRMNPNSYSSSEAERDAIDLLAACTKSWRRASGEGESATLLVKGEELSCTPENAKRLYSTFPWIKEQLDEAISDRANFLKS
jgi:hypothetical protein